MAEELRAHPPFSEREGELLLLLAEHTEIQYLAAGDVLFAVGDPLPGT